MQPNTPFSAKSKTFRLFSFGGEKGIRTLEYIPALHDFQSCAFDQLSHLSRTYLFIIPPVSSHHSHGIYKRLTVE